MTEPTLYSPEDSYFVPPAVPNESPLEFDARVLAAHAHRTQKRSYTGDPYIVHPKAVAELVRSVPHHLNMIAIAWLHDTVEDTELTLEEIGNTFHDLAIMEGVQALTNVKTQPGLNRQARKRLDVERLHLASPFIKTVKLADLIDNSASITEYDPNFARLYLKEKRTLLGVLKAGDKTLWIQADNICARAGY